MDGAVDPIPGVVSHHSEVADASEIQNPIGRRPLGDWASFRFVVLLLASVGLIMALVIIGASVGVRFDASPWYLWTFSGLGVALMALLSQLTSERSRSLSASDRDAADLTAEGVILEIVTESKGGGKKVLTGYSEETVEKLVDLTTNEVRRADGDADHVD